MKLLIPLLLFTTILAACTSAAAPLIAPTPEIQTSVDAEALVALPSATPTWTPVPLSTATSQPARTPSPPTSTPSPTLTPTLPPLPTATPIALPTATPIALPTATPIALPTATPIALPTATPTALPTATPTALPTATPPPAPTRVPSITGLSASEFTTAQIEAWTKVGVSNLAATPPDILGVIWSIGSEIGKTGDVGSPFSKYTQVRTSSELTEIANATDAWIDASGCDKDTYRAYENIELKSRLRVWIEGNYDAATAPTPCVDARIAIASGNSEQSSDVIQKIYMHELYHVLQPTLWDGCMPMGMKEGYYQPLDAPVLEAKHNAGRWFAEGTAEYFAFLKQAEIKGTANAIPLLFAAASSAANESKNINDSIATTGSAAVRLLVERGVITEEQILKGSLFETCDWIDTFGADVPEVIHAKANWHRIQNIGGTWGFTAAALKK
jgi:hypothetical protein